MLSGDGWRRYTYQRWCEISQIKHIKKNKRQNLSLLGLPEVGNLIHDQLASQCSLRLLPPAVAAHAPNRSALVLRLATEEGF